MNKEDLFDSSDRLLGRFDFAARLAAVEQEHQQHTRALLISFIEVMDSFDRLFDSLKESPETSPEQERSLLNTVRLIARQLERALQKAGVTYIPCLNLSGDPEKHLIIDVKELPGVAEDTIVQEVFKGYEWEGEVLRIPHVIVAGGASHSLEEE